MCISLNLGRRWPDEVYVDVVHAHTKPSMMCFLYSLESSYSIFNKLHYVLIYLIYQFEYVYMLIL